MGFLLKWWDPPLVFVDDCILGKYFLFIIYKLIFFSLFFWIVEMYSLDIKWAGY